MIVSRAQRALGQMVSPGAVVLVACSGGGDSVALLHVLAKLAPRLRFSLQVASIDHGLRPEAAAEVELVRSLAERLALPFVTRRLQLAEGANVQARARGLRYEALHELAALGGATRIATGHTRSDQAETVLDRILHGAGVHGLAGIVPVRRDGVIRPLLECSRQDVRAYAAKQGLRWVDDPSNLDAKYLRVRVRHQIVPDLVKEDARLEIHLAALAAEALAERRWARREAARLAEAHAVQNGLLWQGLAEVAPQVRTEILRRWLQQSTGKAPRRAHLQAIAALRSPEAAVRIVGGRQVVLRNGVLELLPE